MHRKTYITWHSYEFSSGCRNVGRQSLFQDHVPLETFKPFSGCQIASKKRFFKTMYPLKLSIFKHATRNNHQPTNHETRASVYLGVLSFYWVEDRNCGVQAVTWSKDSCNENLFGQALPHQEENKIT